MAPIIAHVALRFADAGKASLQQVLVYCLLADDRQQASIPVSDMTGKPLPDLAAKVADAHATLQASYLTPPTSTLQSMSC